MTGMTTRPAVGIDPVHHGEAERWGGWHWEDPRHHEHFRRCSYCGGIHPEDLAAEPQWRADWADMKYGYPHKFYVDMPNREPDQLFYTGSVSRWDEKYRAQGYTPTDELTEEQRAILRDDTGRDPEPGQGWMLGTRANHFGKFYTAHLADPAIKPEIKEAVYVRSGIKVEFKGGRITWQPWPSAGPPGGL